jgi:hypothetical protein
MRSYVRPMGMRFHVIRTDETKKLETLSDDGTWMIVEPYAGDNMEENLTPVGRIFYSASTAYCLPMSRSQEIDAGLGVVLLEVVDLGEPLGFGLGCNCSIPKERLSWFTVTLV